MGARLVVLAVPLTDETHCMIGFEQLQRTAADSITVNVARGGVLNTDGLIEALDADKIFAACIDVTDPDPLPSKSLLWNYRNVLITPRIRPVVARSRPRVSSTDSSHDTTGGLGDKTCRIELFNSMMKYSGLSAEFNYRK